MKGSYTFNLPLFVSRHVVSCDVLSVKLLLGDLDGETLVESNERRQSCLTMSPGATNTNEKGIAYVTIGWAATAWCTKIALYTVGPAKLIPRLYSTCLLSCQLICVTHCCGDSVISRNLGPSLVAAWGFSIPCSKSRLPLWTSDQALIGAKLRFLPSQLCAFLDSTLVFVSKVCSPGASPVTSATFWTLRCSPSMQMLGCKHQKIKFQKRSNKSKSSPICDPVTNTLKILWFSL